MEDVDRQLKYGKIVGFFLYFYFTYCWLCCVFIAVWTSLVVVRRGSSLASVQWLLIAVASLIEEPRALGRKGFSCCGAWPQYLQVLGFRTQDQ